MDMKDVEEFHIEQRTDDKDKNDEKPRTTIRTAVDLQRLKLEKLMKNPDKPVIIPELPKERDFLHSVPSFVRNVMGSSAGAGSGEFHVYRHLRRKEYARQKYIQSKSIREQLDEEFQAKLEQNRLLAQAKTAKKRAKRQQKKAKMKQREKKSKTSNKDGTPDYNDEDSSNQSSDREENEEKTEIVGNDVVKEEETSKSEQAEEELNEKSIEYTAQEKHQEKKRSPEQDIVTEGNNPDPSQMTITQ